MTDPAPPPKLTTNGTGSTTIESAFAYYMMERRRALITEIRQIEKMLGLPQSIPEKRK